MPRLIDITLAVSLLILFVGCGSETVAPVPAGSTSEGNTANGEEIPMATKSVDVSLTDSAWLIDGQRYDPETGKDGLVAILGEPSRTTDSPVAAVTWDELGMYARLDGVRVSEVGFLVGKPSYKIEFQPTAYFSGAVIVDGVELRSGVERAVSSTVQNAQAVFMYADNEEGDLVEIIELETE